MKFYHRVNKYILERYPLLWNTHFVWMMLAGVLLNVIFYIYGYKHIDFIGLQESRSSNYFFNSAADVYFTVVMIAMGIFFGFRYFRHGGFNSMYQISKWYFVKLFFFLFVIGILYSQIPYSFNTGSKDKILKILPLDEFVSDVETINKASVFLLKDIEEYSIVQKAFPLPFPLTELSTEYISVDDKENDRMHGIDVKKPYVEFDGYKYQFGTLKYSKDSCNQRQIVDSVFDVSKVEGLNRFSLYNYSSFYKDHLSDSMEFDYATLHNWVKTKDVGEVTKVLTSFNQILDKYKLAHNIDPTIVANISLEIGKNLDSMMQVLVHDARGGDIQQMINQGYKYYLYYDGLSEIIRNRTNLIQNVRILSFNPSIFISNSSFDIIVLMVMIISMLLIILKHIELVAILMGIVLSGLIAALFGILMSLFDTWRDYYSFHWISFGFCFLVMSIFAYILVKRSTSLKWAKWLFMPAISALVAIVPISFDIISNWTKVPYFSKCDNSINYRYTIEYGFTHFIIIYLILFLVVFYVIRLLKARPE